MRFSFSVLRCPLVTRMLPCGWEHFLSNHPSLDEVRPLWNLPDITEHWQRAPGNILQMPPGDHSPISGGSWDVARFPRLSLNIIAPLTLLLMKPSILSCCTSPHGILLTCNRFKGMPTSGVQLRCPGFNWLEGYLIEERPIISQWNVSRSLHFRTQGFIIPFRVPVFQAGRPSASVPCLSLNAFIFLTAYYWKLELGYLCALKNRTGPDAGFAFTGGGGGVSLGMWGGGPWLVWMCGCIDDWTHSLSIRFGHGTATYANAATIEATEARGMPGPYAAPLCCVSCDPAVGPPVCTNPFAFLGFILCFLNILCAFFEFDLVLVTHTVCMGNGFSCTTSLLQGRHGPNHQPPLVPLKD